MEIRYCAPFQKWLPGSEPVPGDEKKPLVGLKGSTLSFQLAVRSPAPAMKVTTEGLPAAWIRLRKVEFVTVPYLAPQFDDNVLTDQPGTFPDVLRDLPRGRFTFDGHEWRGLWVTITIPSSVRSGRRTLTLHLVEEAGERLDFSLDLIVLSGTLPKQKLLYTNWFHADCLASIYHVPVWSEEHWRIVGNFMESARRHGITLLYTPLFTPPLDTAVGHERPTNQLVKVTQQKKELWEFDFTLLTRWIALARRKGFQYFEFSHLFTQWGAKAAPKVVATVNGKERRIFGWETDAGSLEYREFLHQFLAALKQYVEKHDLKRFVYFHCSDEPGPAHKESYAKAEAFLKHELPGYKIIDALSDLEFYTEHLCDYPVPGIGNFHLFYDAGMRENWIYHCGDCHKVFNRFLHHPLMRTRVLGMLLFRFHCKGFLHWGFNFYYMRGSLAMQDPYHPQEDHYTKDPGFAAGDAWVVYPGPKGEPEDSIRCETVAAAIQDVQILEYLARRVPRADLEQLIDATCPDGKMSVFSYPKTTAAWLCFQNRIDELLLLCDERKKRSFQKGLAK